MGAVAASAEQEALEGEGFVFTVAQGAQTRRR